MSQLASSFSERVDSWFDTDIATAVSESGSGLQKPKLLCWLTDRLIGFQDFCRRWRLEWAANINNTIAGNEFISSQISCDFCHVSRADELSESLR